MDAADIFRSVLPRQPLSQLNPHYYMRGPVPLPATNIHVPRRVLPSRLDLRGHDPDNRIAHTLTACCRCRQRKTRCDPALPRCLPCERSGSVCEYFDTTKGKKISRNYVVQLQEKVRALNNELSQYTDEEADPYDGFMGGNVSGEGLLRPGEMVRLNDGCDETPRYLGPSSGIAMTRLLMEAAKRYTDSARISELFPNVRVRRSRMQSVVMGGTAVPPARRRSYPMVSEVAAEMLPNRQVVDRLIEVFNQRAQLFWPTLHEKLLATELDDVYADDGDPYKNFVVRMVIAISLQKIDTQYAGLADSYYLAAMRYFEDVIRSKDLKTLQCLVLIGQYSLLTPTRNAVYFIIGLATRICQQLGFADEKTIRNGYAGAAADPLTLDLRRRIFWTIASMELGLAHSMGRPDAFAKGHDLMDVEFFSEADDKNISEEGIAPGAPRSERKLFAIQLCKLAMCQAEIRRTLYEKKRDEPRDENHPWYAQMEQSIQQWLEECPTEPAWCRPWFTGRYHQLRVFLHRPSPQVPKPTPAAAAICYESAAHVIRLSKQQVERAAVDVTWVFLLAMYMALNTVLWAASSYPGVRAAHSRDEVEELVNITVDILEQCSERWPGTRSAAELYNIFSRACLQAYESSENTPGNPCNTPPSLFDGNSSANSDSVSPHPNPQPQGLFGMNGEQFHYVFGGPAPEPPSAISASFQFDPESFKQQTLQDYHSGGPARNQPTFRSNSIFFNPTTNDGAGRRFSYFPPEFLAVPIDEPSPEDTTPPASATSTTGGQHPRGPTSPSQPSQPSHLPTPPEPLAPAPMRGATTPSSTAAVSVSPVMAMAPHLPANAPPARTQTSPIHLLPSHHQPSTMAAATNPTASPPKAPVQQAPVQQAPQLRQPQQPPPRAPTCAMPAAPNHHHHTTAAQQRPLPDSTAASITDWFNPPAPFISPFAFSSLGSNVYSDGGATSAPLSALHGQGQNPHQQPQNSVHPGYGGPDAMPAGSQLDFGGQGRHGSLTQQQQQELMSMLENEGMNDIEAFLSLGMGVGEEPPINGVRWQ